MAGNFARNLLLLGTSTRLFNLTKNSTNIKCSYGFFQAADLNNGVIKILRTTCCRWKCKAIIVCVVLQSAGHLPRAATGEGAPADSVPGVRARGSRPGRVPRAAQAVAVDGARPHVPDSVRRRLSAQPPHRAQRPQAAEHPGHRRGPRQTRRLRPRQDLRPRHVPHLGGQ